MSKFWKCLFPLVIEDNWECQRPSGGHLLVVHLESGEAGASAGGGGTQHGWSDGLRRGRKVGWSWNGSHKRGNESIKESALNDLIRIETKKYWLTKKNLTMDGLVGYISAPGNCKKMPLHRHTQSHQNDGRNLNIKYQTIKRYDQASIIFKMKKRMKFKT